MQIMMARATREGNTALVASEKRPSVLRYAGAASDQRQPGKVSGAEVRFGPVVGPVHQFARAVGVTESNEVAHLVQQQ